MDHLFLCAVLRLPCCRLCLDGGLCFDVVQCIVAAQALASVRVAAVLARVADEGEHLRLHFERARADGHLFVAGFVSALADNGVNPPQIANTFWPTQLFNAWSNVVWHA